MARKLTKVKTKGSGSILAGVGDVNRDFIISFKFTLEKEYNLTNLQISQIKQFQVFLDKVSQMTWLQVDKKFKRKPDKQDTFKDVQVIHYKVAAGFRIHGIVMNGRFKVLRLDPNHKVHN
ncbi:hypothetical protein JR334_02090 [Clostridia bacterium]|nr:hypothetical protein JR334_02090 [Clostridia bacterium]